MIPTYEHAGMVFERVDDGKRAQLVGIFDDLIMQPIDGGERVRVPPGEFDNGWVLLEPQP